MKLLPLSLALISLTLFPFAPVSGDTTSLVTKITYTFATSDEKAYDYRPVFSPNDQQLIFEHHQILPTVDSVALNTLKIGTDELKPLPIANGFPYESTRAQWSQHNVIAFTGQVPGDAQSGTLWTVKPNGQDLIQLKNKDLSDDVAYPHWFPDDQSLAVVDYKAAGKIKANVLKRVYLNPNSPANPVVANLTDPDKDHILVGEPSVSPSGRYIALAAQKDDHPYDQNNNQIYIYDVATGNISLFADGQGRAPSWSPDGNWITFESYRNDGIPLDERKQGIGYYAIYAKHFPSGGKLVQLTPHGLFAQHASWSHDGQSIVCAVQLNDRDLPTQPDGETTPPPTPPISPYGIMIMHVPLYALYSLAGMTPPSHGSPSLFAFLDPHFSTRDLAPLLTQGLAE